MTPPPQIEHKTLAAPPLEYKSAPTLVAPEETGVVEAYVAVTGVRDDVGDIIVPGAFSRTLKILRPKMCLGHDWNRPIGEPEEIIELMPGDPRLPSTTADGKPWPVAAGALYTRSRYMDTQDGQDARAQAQFYGARTAYSIGYVAKDARQGVDPVSGEPTRYLHDVDLYEYGPVLHGAHRLAHQKSVKSVAEELETKVRVVRDPAYWGLPIGTPIIPGMKPNGPKAQQRRERGQDTPENVGVVEIEPVVDDESDTVDTLEDVEPSDSENAPQDESDDVPEEEPGPEARGEPEIVELAPGEASAEPYKPTGRTDAVGAFTDDQLAAEIDAMRQRMRKVPRPSAQYDTAKAQLRVLETEQRKREAAAPGGQERQRVRADVSRYLSWPAQDQPAFVAKLSDEELAAYDAELSARADSSGGNERIAQSHQVLQDELTKRGSTTATDSTGEETAPPAPTDDERMAQEDNDAEALGQSATRALSDGDTLTLSAALRDLGVEQDGEDPVDLAERLAADPEAGAAQLNQIIGSDSERRGQDQDARVSESYVGMSDEELASALEEQRSTLAELTAQGTPPEDFGLRMAARRERAILAEQERRTQQSPQGDAESESVGPALVAELAADDEAMLVEAADTVQGITEDTDGQLEVDDDVAERQERVASLLARADSGELNLSQDTEQTLRITRADVIGEIRLQDYLTTRGNSHYAENRPPRVAAEQDDTRLSEAEALNEAVPETPKPRPGVTGAAEDLADALESEDEQRIIAARARLTVSLNRSRSVSTGVQTLRTLMDDGQETPQGLRDLADAIRIEARARRNASARSRRQVRRFERERLRSLLAEIDAEMSRRGLDFDPLSNPEGETGEIRSFAERVGVGGTWVFAASEPGVLGVSAQSWTVRGPRYRATIENSRYFGGTESETTWRWEVLDRDGEVITSGTGRSPDQASARAEVEADLSIQQALGALPVDTVLPHSGGPFTSSGRSEETVQARIEDMSRRLNSPAGARRNILSGQRDPLTPPATRPPAVQAFPSLEAVRAHLSARAAAGSDNSTEIVRLNHFLRGVQWDDVTLSPGGGLMVTKSQNNSGYIVTHTGTGAEVRVMRHGSTGMDKSTATKMATLLESLVDDSGNTVNFATDDIAVVRAGADSWAQDGRAGYLALGDAVGRALLGEQLRNARWNSNPVKSIRLTKDGDGQTNPTRLGYIQQTASGIRSLIGNKPGPIDKETLDIVRGSEVLYHTGAPDAAAVLLRRRATELRSGEAESQGAQLLENLANGYLSSWAPQASPGERVLSLRTGERVAFADGPEDIRVYRAIGEPRAHAYGEGVIVKVVDEQTGQRYELRAGGPSSSVSLSGEYDGRQNATLRYVPLGNPEYVVLGPDEQPPATRDELTAAAWAELDSIPAAVLDAAAEIAPETRAERGARAAAAPRGVRAPRRRSAAAPRRGTPETAVPTPVAGEEKLAIGQARVHQQWLGDGLTLADSPLPGGFSSLAEARGRARARADEVPGTDEGNSMAFVAGKLMEAAILSPGGHFAVVPSNNTVVHLRSGLTVWGMGDTSRDVDENKMSAAAAGQVASYMERVNFNGAPVDWSADLEQIREQLKGLLDHRLDQFSPLERFAAKTQANPLVRIGRIALADYMASVKNPLTRDIAGFSHSAADAPQVWFNPGSIAKLNPFLESEKYNALAGRRSLHFSGLEYTSETKAGATLARKVAAEIQVADALSRVSPLGAVRRLNRLAREWEGQEIQPREGGALRPADYLRRLATAITDAWDENKISASMKALRANFTGEMTLTAYTVTPKGENRANGTDKLAAIKVTEQLASSPSIRIFRDPEGNVHATFAGRSLVDFADRRNRPASDSIQFGQDGSVRMIWREKTGYSNGITLEVPADDWDFIPEDAEESDSTRPAERAPADPGAIDEDAAQRPPFPSEEEE